MQVRALLAELNTVRGSEPLLREYSFAAGLLETATSLNQEEEGESEKGKHGHGTLSTVP